jgi:hypothetical protein
LSNRKNKAKSTREKAKGAFPDTPLERITPCANKPYFKRETREDYVVATEDEAKDKAFELAGIDTNRPREGEQINEIREPPRPDGTLIGYEAVDVKTGKMVAEVHFHPTDLEGHEPQEGPLGRDYISEMPHYNYANWRSGKQDGRYGHIVFKG